MFGIATSRRYAPKCACAPGICANMHDKATQTKPLATINGTISRNMPTNLEPKRLKSKLDFKKIEFGGFAVEAATHRADYSPQQEYAPVWGRA